MRTETTAQSREGANSKESWKVRLVEIRTMALPIYKADCLVWATPEFLFALLYVYGIV